MKGKLVLTGWICIFTSLLGMASPKGGPVPKAPASKVFLISIGVNQEQGNLWCNYCDNDAMALKERLEEDTSNFHFKLSAYTLMNDSATLQKLNLVFSEVAVQARSYDRVILYYSGVSVNIKGKNKEEAENHFLMAKAKFDSTGVSGDFFTIAMLKTWLDRIAAENFLLVSDAGITQAYISDFLLNLTNIKSNWSKVDDKKRIFLYPNIAGIESNQSKRGNFSEILTSLPVEYSLADIFQKKEAVIAALKCAESTMFPGEAAKTFSLNYFDERDFIKSYSFLLPNPSSSRGGDIEDEAADSAEALTRPPRKIALVIGIDRYQYWDALNNPVFDANTIGNILTDVYGFEVWRLTANPTVDDIINAIDSLSRQNMSGPMDQIFVFFAGHGFVDPLSGTGHLIASDSKKGTKPTDVRSMIQHNYLINLLNSIKCKHLLLVIDACYSGSIQQATGPVHPSQCDFRIPINWKNLYMGLSNEQYIQRNMQCPTRRYITSGGKDYKVPDGEAGKHSPFANALINKLKTGDKTDGIVTFTELLPDLSYVNPMPRSGNFGIDGQSGDYLFIQKK